MMRSDGRQPGKIRPLSITRNYIKHAEGSALVVCGETRVICTASLETRVPFHLKGTGTGWVSAEYSMIPRATNTRTPRAKTASGGRSHEIQRLIGRSLRAVTDLAALGEMSILLDCDVIQADGGTRTAAVNGAFVALVDALRKIQKERKLLRWPLRDFVSAVSVGMLKEEVLLDLTYEEDSLADVDMNVAMTGSGRFVEIQGTGEESSFSEEDLQKLLAIAKLGIAQVLEVQKKAVGSLP